MAHSRQSPGEAYKNAARVKTSSRQKALAYIFESNHLKLEERYPDYSDQQLPTALTDTQKQLVKEVIGNVESTLKKELREYQRSLAGRLLKQRGLMCYWEVGTGKTLFAATEASILLKAGLVERVIIVTQAKLTESISDVFESAKVGSVKVLSYNALRKKVEGGVVLKTTYNKEQIDAVKQIRADVASLFEGALVIFDEAHNACTDITFTDNGQQDEWKLEGVTALSCIIASYLAKRVLLLTATPCRTSKMDFDNLFTMLRGRRSLFEPNHWGRDYGRSITEDDLTRYNKATGSMPPVCTDRAYKCIGHMVSVYHHDQRDINFARPSVSIKQIEIPTLDCLKDTMIKFQGEDRSILTLSPDEFADVLLDRSNFLSNVSIITMAALVDVIANDVIEYIEKEWWHKAVIFTPSIKEDIGTIALYNAIEEKLETLAQTDNSLLIDQVRVIQGNTVNTDDIVYSYNIYPKTARYGGDPSLDLPIHTAKKEVKIINQDTYIVKCARVLIVSQQCASVGFNFMNTSQVFFHGGFWNDYEEKQALGRALRLKGSEKIKPGPNKQAEVSVMKYDVDFSRIIDKGADKRAEYYPLGADVPTAIGGDQYSKLQAALSANSARKQELDAPEKKINSIAAMISKAKTLHVSKEDNSASNKADIASLLDTLCYVSIENYTRLKKKQANGARNPRSRGTGRSISYRRIPPSYGRPPPEKAQAELANLIREKRALQKDQVHTYTSTKSKPLDPILLEYWKMTKTGKREHETKPGALFPEVVRDAMKGIVTRIIDGLNRNAELRNTSQRHPYLKVAATDDDIVQFLNAFVASYRFNKESLDETLHHDDIVLLQEASRKLIAWN